MKTKETICGCISNQTEEQAACFFSRYTNLADGIYTELDGDWQYMLTPDDENNTFAGHTIKDIIFVPGTPFNIHLLKI